MSPTKETIENAVVIALKNIFDPEIPVNIYDLGLIYAIDVDDELNVKITMTLTSPNCPVAESLPNEVKSSIKMIDGVKEVDIQITFDPPWSMENLSEEAMLELGML